MIRLFALSLGLTLIIPGYPHAAGIGAPGSCPRPADQYGLLYDNITGAYRSRGETQGGGKYVTIVRDGSAISVPVSGDVFSIAGNIRPGTRVTLLGYVGSGSGKMPPYSCIELAP
jgi:hypothetical protein